jgi:transposase
LLWVVTAAAGSVRDAEGAEAPSLDAMLAEALEANRQLSELVSAVAEENARLRARDAERDAELERVRADLAVLQRMLFGRSSEKARPGPPAGGPGDDFPDDGGAGNPGSGDKGVKRGPGARAGRRDYSHLPRVEVTWDFPGGGYCCPECGEAFTLLGSHVSGEQLDWRVSVRVVAHCRRRYKRACGCRVPATVMAPGPPKAVSKGLFSNAFTAMLLTERFAAGRSMNSLVTGLSRQGAEVSPATLAGTCAQAAGLLAPVADAIAARNRDSWHLHADETTWRVFAPRDGSGPAKWWLWVFIGPDTVCFVMDPSRSGQVLARHAGIDEETGQLEPDEDGGQRRLVVSSDFYAVYQSAGKKADGLVNLYCWAHVRRHFVRAGDASPVQLKYWTQAWLELIRALYAAHDRLAAAWQENAAPAAKEKEAAAGRMAKALEAWDSAIGAIDEARKKQAQAPGLQEPAKKALATLDREWDGLIAHRDYPMAGLDNYADAAVMPMLTAGGGAAAGQGGALAA